MKSRKRYVIGMYLGLILVPYGIIAQTTVDVTEQTIKIGGMKEEEIYIGFAAGDKIVFSFKETNGKELKEVEILEYPSKSRFSDFKVDKIEGKELAVSKQGVYIFRFKNSALGGRVCNIHIQRIPANESTREFNTAVKWINKQDTVWNSYTRDVLIGYDTSYVQETKKELIKSEQYEELIMDKSQRVHSITNSNGNKTILFFVLPLNQSERNKTKKVIAWAYWVGVGEEANEAWRQNSEKIKGAIKSGAALFTTPLGALAIGVIADLLTPTLGEDVSYAIADETNKAFFLAGYSYKVYDSGKGVAGYKKFTSPVLCQGKYFICLSNDNYMQGIDANVKVSAVIEVNTYEDKMYTEMVVKPKYEKQLFKEPKVNSYPMPVTGF